MIEYQLVRSKRRKTLGLQVKNGEVVVRAPFYVTTTFIETFIQEKSVWIRSKIAIQNKNKNQNTAFCDFSHNSPILYFGERLKINIRVEKQPKVFISNPLANSNEPLEITPTLTKQINVVISERVDIRLFDAITSAKQVKKQLESFYKEQAVQVITERLEVIANETGLTPSQVNIRQYRARWGSCNNRGEVSFNYLLMMTPLFVIDYVIVHELCHLMFLNHSKDFWQLVEKHFPNYKDAKAWLKSHQAELNWNI